MRKNALYIPSLDGVRALAVLLVFAAHAGLNERVPGNFGVTVFFFLSGYLITTLLRIEFDRTGRVDFKAFYLRRALRILPPMYLVLAAASTLTAVGALDGSLQLDAIVAQVFHLSNYYIVANGWWDGRAPGTWVYWSLAVEEHFYLLFPLAYLALRRLVPSARIQALVLLLFCGLVLAWRFDLVIVLHAIKDRTYIASDTRVDSILFGCVLAVFGNPVLDRTRLSDRGLVALLPLAFTGLLISFLVNDQRVQETVRYSLQGVCLFPLFIAAMRFHNRSVFRFLNWRPVRYVGVISYSIYLLHPTVLYAVDQWTSLNKVVQAGVSLVLTLALATAIHYVVERPCARLRKRLEVYTHSQSAAASLGTALSSGAPAVRRLDRSAQPILNRP